LFQFKLRFHSYLGLKNTKSVNKTSKKQGDGKRPIENHEWNANLRELVDAMGNLRLDHNNLNEIAVNDSTINETNAMNQKNITARGSQFSDGNIVSARIDENHEKEYENVTRYEVKMITNHGLDDYGHRLYYTAWKGATDDSENEYTWESEENFDSSVPIIRYYVNKVNTLTQMNNNIRKQIKFQRNESEFMNDGIEFLCADSYILPKPLFEFVKLEDPQVNESGTFAIENTRKNDKSNREIVANVGPNGNDNEVSIKMEMDSLSGDILFQV
jgi:hypothetical protein